MPEIKFFMSSSSTNNTLVISYLGLRKSIGIIGIALPFVLIIGRTIFEDPGILSSISSYYYSVMGDVFVGSLCAIGVFLLSYRGYERSDAIAGNLACIFAIGVALFPTAPDVNATFQQHVIGAVHIACAASLFATLAYFSLFLFRKTSSEETPTPRKLLRNTIYTICGNIIVVCIVGIIFVNTFSLPRIADLNPVFWFESFAIFSFGVSWFVKGEAILKDEVAQ